MRSRSYLEIRGGADPNDIMVWPNPEDPEDVEWRLRYKPYFGGAVKTSTLMVAASYMDAYRALIALPQKTRNARIEQIKRAMEVARQREEISNDD